MPRHRDLDFDHASVWCDDCWDQEQRGQYLVELRRSNDLKAREIELREWNEWTEPKWQPKPRYTLPLPPAPIIKGGGINLEPRKPDR